MISRSYLVRWSLTVVIIILFSTGCTQGSYRIRTGEVEFSPGYASGSYTRCHGYKEQVIKAEAGEVYTISNLVRTDEGELQTLMLGPDRAVFGEFSGTGEMVLQISQSGRYRIRVSAQEHQGSFALSWSVDEQGVTQK